ncbi:hypothetical protein BX600DRAFT_442499 [Xylariales sp. PMI_506]|nr:hypothetical protein BX600DRAFT_442499 [Xylariales sp. PMI_506]
MISSLMKLAPFVAGALAATQALHPNTRSANVTAYLETAMSVDPSTFKTYQTGNLQRASVANNASSLRKRDCAVTPIFTFGDTDYDGAGVDIGNGGTEPAFLYFYENWCDTVPYKYTVVEPGTFAFFDLPSDFQGRITRGSDAYNLQGEAQLLGTWIEFSWDANNWVWADISVIRGNDGGAVVLSTDGSNVYRGFTSDVVATAPSDVLAQKSDGQWVINYTEDFYTADINPLPDSYELSVLDPAAVYIDDSHGSPVITSTNGRLQVVVVDGYP